MKRSDRARQTRLPVVWVVDDSPMEQVITERSLGEGYSYVRFSDGAEVIEHVASGSELPDVMLLDWMMPGIAGDEVCRFLRSREATRDLPIIVVTSRMDTSDVVQGLSIGANDYVPRPFAPEELRARVAAVLRAKELADVASRERMRLTAINRLGHRLFAAGNGVEKILEELVTTLVAALCDGCSIELMMADQPPLTLARHYLMTTGVEIATSSDVVAIVPFQDVVTLTGSVTVMRDMGSAPFDADDLASIETCVRYAAVGIERVVRRQSERLANARLEAVLSHAPSGIVVTDATGALTLTNPSAVRLIPGIDGAANISAIHALADWTTLGGAPISKQAWDRATNPSGLPSSVDLVMRTRHMLPARTLSVATAPFTTGGTVAGAVTMIEDISADRQITAERERLAAFQEQMLGIVGHDLRTPLRAMIAGVAAIETRGASVPAIAPIVRLMQSSANRMTAIIDQLVDVTRARLGDGIPVDAQPMSLTDLAREVLAELGLAHPRATFELIAREDVAGVWDRERLSKVISNLASNAVHYGMPAQPIVVEVVGAATTATMTVKNAILEHAIEPARLREIFEPRRRGGDEKRVGGIGLGLYIVSEIVRAHGGTIVAESSPDGTIFCVELPR